jgi:hypothetical protein
MEWQMNASFGGTDAVAQVVAAARAKGVRLWADQGRLHYRAPKGALAAEEIEYLRKSSGQIIALLEDPATESRALHAQLGPARQTVRAPLAYSQLAHWNLYRLGERSALRQIAAATRLQGPLNLAVLRSALDEVVRRHESLRTCFVNRGGSLAQEVLPSRFIELQTEDMRNLSSGEQAREVLRSIDQFILEPVDPTSDPLLGLRLLRLADDENVLVLAMEHLISDAVSRGLLLRELFTAYSQLIHNQALSLPAIGVQFPDYALRQASGQDLWRARHASYWQEFRAGRQSMRFPVDGEPVDSAETGRGSVPMVIDRQRRNALLEWSRSRRSTLVLSVFCAYIALLTRWCNSSEAVVQYISDGRSGPGTEHTIGYFACPLHMRIRVDADTDFVTLLRRSVDAYCKAYEHMDSWYFASGTQRPEFAFNPAFNWVAPGSRTGCATGRGLRDELRQSSIQFQHPLLRDYGGDNEPSIVLYDDGEEIVGNVNFPRRRFSAASMERFARNLLGFIDSLLTQPGARIFDISLGL